MAGDDPSSHFFRGVRLRRCVTVKSAIELAFCFPDLGGFFICPKFRGQTVTQAGI